MDGMIAKNAGKCPGSIGQSSQHTNRDWWPNRSASAFSISTPLSNRWAEVQLREDVKKERSRGGAQGPPTQLMTESQEWCRPIAAITGRVFRRPAQRRHLPYP